MAAELVTRRCEYCKKDFETTEPDKVYCNKTHKRAAAKQRRADKDELDALQHGPLCPTPLKRSYTSIEAWEASGLPATQEPYRCRCGGIHGYTKMEFKTAGRTTS